MHARMWPLTPSCWNTDQEGKVEEGSSRLRGRGRRYSVAVFLIDDGDDAVFINHALYDTGGHRSLVRATIFFQ